MAYTIRVQKRDGSIEMARKSVLVHGDPAAAENVCHETLQERRKRIRNKGWSPKKDAKLVAQIPQVVWELVVKRDGPEASHDLKHVIREAERQGFNVRGGLR